MTDHIHLSSEDLPGCNACGDPTERTCVECGKSACERHVIDGVCEACLVKAGEIVNGCDFCGDTLLGGNMVCTGCRKHLNLPAAATKEAA
jgi:hypothetical protein